MDLTVAIPCRTDEPDPVATAEQALEELQRHRGPAGRGELLVCLNGPGSAHSTAAAMLREFAVRRGLCLTECEATEGPGKRPGRSDRASLVLLHAAHSGKALAWNHLRRAACGEYMAFLDADVQCHPGAVRALWDALAAAPDAVLAGGRTVAAPRPGWFERMQATPYGVVFPNLSPQMYGARRRLLPPAMPEGLLEPERWLELVVGPERILRVPGATVAVRLPGDLRDFVRQRLRIEMAKVQLWDEFPGLAQRSAPQPGWRAALQLGPADLGRLGIYLLLREVLHTVARWRYRRADVTRVWRQAASTKRWDHP